MKKLIHVITSIAIVMVLCNNANAQWKSLIKNDLSNWTQLSGAATFAVKDGIIIGTTKTGPPYHDSFLCTRADFDNFILEFDCWVDPSVNSGVNFRSGTAPNLREGSVYGDQIEIDPSERAWTGGIYDQSRRGWLYTLDINPPAKKAFKNGVWNHYRIEALGNSIRTWVNNIPCADLIDDVSPSGFIGLQVHAIGTDSSQAGKVVKWKNIRIITENVEKYMTPYKPVIKQVSFLTNKLSDREIKEGWKLLWDGKTTNGWRGAKLNSFPKEGWKIKNGTLDVITTGGGESEDGGDIVTVNKYKDFELIVDFRYTSGANSGIKYFVNTDLNKGAGSSIGCEYQILDDRHHPDAKEGVAGDRTLAGLYDLIPPRKKRDNGIGAWNRATIIVKGDHVEHWLNGQMTLEYKRNSDMWRALVSKSKYNIWPGFGDAKEGNILLQEHGFEVSFRNIKIKEL